MATLISFFWDDYFREYQLKSTSAETYRSALQLFENWFESKQGRPVEWRDICHQVVNDWIIEFGEGRSTHTVRSRKLSIMAILNTGRRRGLCSFDPDRIRKVRVDGTPKDYWEIGEVADLVDACDSLRGRFRSTQIRQDYYAKAYILTVWDTALRRGDMAVIRAGVIDSTLQFSHPRSKTGVTDICRLNPNTYRWIQLTFDEFNASRKLLFPPWQKGKNALRPVSELFGRLMLIAGLRASDSCLKKLVRSSIMEADGQAPGTGWLQGHHADPATTMQAYANRQRANLNRPLNREIA